jgi:hypothetical protein
MFHGMAVRLLRVNVTSSQVYLWRIYRISTIVVQLED